MFKIKQDYNVNCLRSDQQFSPFFFRDNNKNTHGFIYNIPDNLILDWLNLNL